MRVAVDFDDTIADMSTVACAVLSEMVGKEIKKKDWTDWDMNNLGIPKEKFFEAIRLMCEKGLYRQVPFVSPSCLPTLKTLAEAGFILDVVTERQSKQRRTVLDWLKVNKVPYNTLVLVRIGKSKAALGYDVYVDDNPIQAVKIAKTGKVCLLYDQPWNRSLEENERIIRVRSWDEVMDKLFEMRGNRYEVR